MPYYSLPEQIWLDLFLFVAGSFLLIWLFNAVMRKWLGIRKMRVFKMHYVNETHRKWDFRLRMGYLGLFLLVLLVTLALRLYIPWFVLGLIPLYAMQTVLQAYLEWKHGEGRTQAIYEAAEFGVTLGVLLALAWLLFPEIRYW
ncbi:DUF4181 domain-containing protein [Indiicoccus explosivorum]|uniref:DUF4181 domain-containing protein n=1 Tax=Indiicoccus explosivorum TaxID=1917864 RepID=UPI000B44E612|nr:DUF4181 domain-containing protein [Indiicoccus explosivorum]